MSESVKKFESKHVGIFSDSFDSLLLSKFRYALAHSISKKEEELLSKRPDTNPISQFRLSPYVFGGNQLFLLHFFRATKSFVYRIFKRNKNRPHIVTTSYIN